MGDTLPDAPTHGELTTWLDAAAAGDRAAFDRAFALLYDELSRLARAQRRQWVGNETLNTTVLVHEAYLKLVARDEPDTGEGARWTSRRHFFVLASQVMRQLLVNYAERQRATKRGGDAMAVPLDALAIGSPEARIDDDWIAAHEPGTSDSADEIIALHRALGELSARDARQARIVECRFFGGLSIPDTADALDISPATVKREWQSARGWLQAALPRVREEIERAG